MPISLAVFVTESIHFCVASGELASPQPKPNMSDRMLISFHVKNYCSASFWIIEKSASVAFL